MEFLDWRTLPPGREKYFYYLCSPEWGALREAVRARSGGWCEQCGEQPATATHHLTYARIYAERISDLAHLCDDCHAERHGRPGQMSGQASAVAYQPSPLPALPYHPHVTHVCGQRMLGAVMLLAALWWLGVW